MQPKGYFHRNRPSTNPLSVNGAYLCLSSHPTPPTHLNIAIIVCRWLSKTIANPKFNVAFMWYSRFIFEISTVLSETFWVSDCCVTPGEQLACHEIMMMFALYQINMLNCSFIVLDHWNSMQVDLSLHFETLPWFRANQFMLLLFNAACSVEKQQIPIAGAVVVVIVW